MIRSVKTFLRKVLGTSSLKFHELGTVLLEVDAVINSRPLTYIYSATGEPSPIKLAHFLVGRQLTAIPMQTFWFGPCVSGTRKETLHRLSYH